jgi:hypothetical protein
MLCREANVWLIGAQFVILSHWDILNQNIMSTAFQVRWAWNLHAGTKKPWCFQSNPCEEKVRQIFNAGAKVTIGNGKRCFFWLDKYLNGKTIEDIALDVFHNISPVS